MGILGGRHFFSLLEDSSFNPNDAGKINKMKLINL